MGFLIDTNIISEIGKAARCHRNVASWYAAVSDTDLYLSVLVLGEVRRGIERARPSDAVKAQSLQAWLDAVIAAFAERVLPVDQMVADEWGRMAARRSVSTIDALLAATANVHGLTLVTRNVADVADLGASLLNPFELPHSGP